MTDSAPTMDPWEEAAAAQATVNPAVQEPQAPTMDPWEEAQAAQKVSLSTPTGYPEPQLSDNPTAGAEKPPEQKAAELITSPRLAEGMLVGSLGGLATMKAGGWAGSLFETPESLKSAGITASTLEHMAPGGQNPADYVNAVEKQLSGKGVIATTAKETWDKMFPAAQKVGQGVREAMNAIKQAAGPESLMVDANTALDPIANEALKRGTGLFSKTENLANPFYDAYDGLQKIAKEQGGKLSLDNLDAALDETGKIMNEGGEAVKKTFAKLYGKLADARDVIVNTVADQAGDQGLKHALLQNNADYSTYMRVLPSVEKEAYKEGIREGVSTFRKYGGPTVMKYGASGLSALTGEHLIEKLYHMFSGGKE